MKARMIIALDGHDGSGKTTLAAELGVRLGGNAVRPFSGAAGSKLMEAGERGWVEELVTVGSKAIDDAIASVPGASPLVLDRGWLTVASFVPDSELFFRTWTRWMPTALCWADLETTLSRLSRRRDENSETEAWHRRYIESYRQLAERSGSLLLRTDLLDMESCIDRLIAWIDSGPEPPSFAGN